MVNSIESKNRVPGLVCLTMDSNHNFVMLTIGGNGDEDGDLKKREQNPIIHEGMLKIEPGQLYFPGGKVYQGEALRRAANRESLEESRIEVSSKLVTPFSNGILVDQERKGQLVLFSVHHASVVLTDQDISSIKEYQPVTIIDQHRLRVMMAEQSKLIRPREHSFSKHI